MIVSGAGLKEKIIPETRIILEHLKKKLLLDISILYDDHLLFWPGPNDRFSIWIRGDNIAIIKDKFDNHQWHLRDPITFSLSDPDCFDKIINHIQKEQ